MRHSFATSMLEAGVDVLTISKLLGHSSFVTTMIYLHVRRQHFDRSPSPIDWLPVRQCPKWAEESLSQSILPQLSEPPSGEATPSTEEPDNTCPEETRSPVRRTSGRKPRKRRRK
jgi:hypothetical protein